MTIHVSVAPSNPEPFLPPQYSASELEAVAATGDGEPQDELRTRLALAYALRVDDYKKEFAKQQRRNAATGGGSGMSQFHTLTVRFDNENGDPEALDLDIDEDLFTALFDLYSWYGPQGWRHADDALEQAVVAARNDASWEPTVRFFNYTLNLLKLLVRDSLIRLEERAVARLALKLNRTAVAVATAYKRDFKFVPVKVEQDRPAGRGEQRIVTTTEYRMKDAELAKSLHAAMNEAVAKRDVYLKVQEQARAARKQADEQAVRETGPGVRSPSAGYDDRNTAEARARAKEKEAAAAEALFKSLQVAVFYNLPFAVLALPKLTAGFSSEDMQNTIHGVLFEFYEKLDELAVGFNRGSRVAAVVPGIDLGAALSSLKLEYQFPWRFELEATVANRAIDEVKGEPRYFALLAEDLWHELYEAADIDPFDQIVCNHWLDAIDVALARAEAEQRKWQRFFADIARASAALSIAQVFIPEGEAAAAVLRVTGVSDKVLLLYAAWSVSTQLNALNEAVGQAVIDFDVHGMNGMSRLALVMKQRREYRDQLPLEIATELALMSVADFRLVKAAMRARGFVQDLETLMPDENTDG